MAWAKGIMGTQSEAAKEALLAELEIHKTEFSTLRDEILQNIEAQRQYLNLSIIAAGAGIGLAPFISGQNASIALLLFPLVFHVMLSEMISTVNITRHIADYMLEKLIPRVNAILDELGIERKEGLALGWEIYVTSLPQTKSSMLWALTAPSREWIPILAVAALLVLYVLTTQTPGYQLTIGELSLVFVNLIMLIAAAVRNMRITRETLKQRQKLLAAGYLVPIAVNAPHKGKNRSKVKERS
jgi:hypothetical protein